MANLNSFLIIFLLIFVGCDDDNNTKSGNDSMLCNTEEPLTELSWLKEIKDNAEQSESDTSEIYFCIYEEKEGFLIDLCVQCPDALTVFYDCEGNVLCEFGGYLGTNTCPDFDEKISKKELLWKHPQ